MNISLIGISLDVKFSIPTKILESYSHFLAFLINHTTTLPKIFLMSFSDEMMNYKGQLKLLL